MEQTITLPEAFGLTGETALVAFVGGGGKTSLMLALARALPGRVVMTTTTHLATEQLALAPAVCRFGRIDHLGEKLATHRICLVVGETAGHKVLGVPTTLPQQLLARDDVDMVLVEADGARRRPIKAPADHEPALPDGVTLVVPVMGIDALDRPIAASAHRPEQVARLTGLRPDALLDAVACATLLTHRHGGRQGVPPGVRVVPFINKVAGNQSLAAARRIARHSLREGAIDRVVIGALATDTPVCAVIQRDPELDTSSPYTHFFSEESNGE